MSDETGAPMEEIIREIERLTPSQQHTLGCVAIGRDGGHSRQTLASLVTRGLIVCREVRQGPFVHYRHDMPLPIHIAWCAWCSRQPAEEEAK